MHQEDAYSVLKVKRSANRKEIAEAYRKQARSVHPDATGKDTSAEFVKISKAYSEALKSLDASRCSIPYMLVTEEELKKKVPCRCGDVFRETERVGDFVECTSCSNYIEIGFNGGVGWLG